jgi:hypothetical protein
MVLLDESPSECRKVATLPRSESPTFLKTVRDGAARLGLGKPSASRGNTWSPAEAPLRASAPGPVDRFVDRVT